MKRLLASVTLAVFGLACPACAPDADLVDADVEDSADAYTVSDLPREVNRRVAKCFVANWSKRDAGLRSDTRYVAGGVFRTIVSLSGRASQSIGHLLLLGSEGEAVLKTLEGDLREIAAAQHLGDEQKALVAACVSSELISYAANGTAKVLGPAAAVAAYEGVCSEYAAINARLLEASGIEGGRLGGEHDGGGHAWNWAKIDGREVWIEPQLNPLRMSGPVFIDPEGKAPAGTAAMTCLPPGATSRAATQCCSGLASTSGESLVCQAPACEAGGKAICTPSAAACTGIGGVVRTASCGASRDGSTCCAFAR